MHKAHETLGCFISITNNQKKQFEVMKKLIRDWVRKIQSSPLSNTDKLSAYKDYLEAKLLYVLPVCSFSWDQCCVLDRILGQLLMNMSGFQRNANRNILYMSEAYGGIKIYSIYHLQGTSKLQFFFRHYRQQDTTGKLILTSLRYTQLEAGLSKSFFKYNYDKTHFLVTPTWLTHLWEYSTSCHTQIHENTPWIYDPPRQHDFFLMDKVVTSNVPQQHKEIFNRIRINLRLLTASDIVIVNHRNRILPYIYERYNRREREY